MELREIIVTSYVDRPLHAGSTNVASSSLSVFSDPLFHESRSFKRVS
jgi:hypothetical protein